jgi:hypothetical protein
MENGAESANGFEMGAVETSSRWRYISVGRKI